MNKGKKKSRQQKAENPNNKENNGKSEGSTDSDKPVVKKVDKVKEPNTKSEEQTADIKIAGSIS